MNKAVFDIGTNSIKLLIYSSPDKTIIAEYMKISQLGENLSKTGLISENGSYNACCYHFNDEL